MGREAVRKDGEIVGWLTYHWEICPECGGDGQHPNRNIDGNGITQSDMEDMDFDEQREFMDTYMSGGYDVSCRHCHGGKIKVYDKPQSESEEVQEAYDECSSEEEDRGRTWRDDPEAQAEQRYFGGWER